MSCIRVRLDKDKKLVFLNVDARGTVDPHENVVYMHERSCGDKG